MEDLRCYTVHLFFRVEGADLYEGGTGYASTNLKYCTNVFALADMDEYQKAVAVAAADIAQTLSIPTESVVPISYDEHKENTDDDEEDT